MTTQTVALTDAELLAVCGGGLTADLTDGAISFVPYVGPVNSTLKKYTDYSIGTGVEKGIDAFKNWWYS